MHHGWCEQLLVYLDERPAYARIDFNKSVYDPANAPVARLHVPELQCPSDTLLPDTPHSSYAACHHDVEAPIDETNNGVFFLNSKIRPDDITDGLGIHAKFPGEKQLDEGNARFGLDERARGRPVQHRDRPSTRRRRLPPTGWKIRRRIRQPARRRNRDDRLGRCVGPTRSRQHRRQNLAAARQPGRWSDDRSGRHSAVNRDDANPHRVPQPVAVPDAAPPLDNGATAACVSPSRTASKSPRGRFSMSALFLLVTIAAVCAAVATSGVRTHFQATVDVGPGVALAITAGILAMILMAYSSVAGIRMLVRAFFIGAAAGVVSYLVLWQPPDIRVLIAGCVVLLSYGLVMRKLQPQPRDVGQRLWPDQAEPTLSLDEMTELSDPGSQNENRA